MLSFVTLPLTTEDLHTLVEGGYSIVDQAARTPGLLIVQRPDEPVPAPAPAPAPEGPGADGQ